MLLINKACREQEEPAKHGKVLRDDMQLEVSIFRG